MQRETWFKKEIEGNLIIVYMDNVLGFSKTLDGLKEIKQIVLEKAQEHDLFFKAKKCEFWKQKIKYLGLVVQKGKLAMDSTRLKRILDCHTPKTVKEVQSFLGFGNFYQWISLLWHILSMIFQRRTKKISGLKNAKNHLIY